MLRVATQIGLAWSGLRDGLNQVCLGPPDWLVTLLPGDDGLARGLFESDGLSSGCCLGLVVLFGVCLGSIV